MSVNVSKHSQSGRNKINGDGASVHTVGELTAEGDWLGMRVGSHLVLFKINEPDEWPIVLVAYRETKP